jgi:hypothetical protein
MMVVSVAMVGLGVLVASMWASPERHVPAAARPGSSPAVDSAKAPGRASAVRKSEPRAGLHGDTQASDIILVEHAMAVLRTRHEQAIAQTEDALAARRAGLDIGDASAAAEALDRVVALVRKRQEMARELSELALQKADLYGR